MRKIAYIILFLFFYKGTIAQNKEIDSLNNVLLNYKKNDTTKVNLLNELSYSYYKSDINKSNEKAKEAFDLAKKLNYKKGEAKSLLRLSSNELKKGLQKEAKEKALKALNLVKEINDQDCINSAYLCLAKVAYYNNDFDKAADFFNKILDYSIKNGDLLSQVDMYNNLGITKYRKGDFDEAINLYKKSLNICEQLGDEKLSLNTLNNIGAICLNQGRFEEALKYFNKCLNLPNDKQGIANSLGNISAVYYELKQYDKTLLYLDKALKLYRELGDRRNIASVLINKGTVYVDLKEFSKALENMTESISISEEINDKTELCAGNFQLGDLYYKMNQPEKAIKYYKISLELSNADGDRIYICHSNIGLAKTYTSIKDYSNALIHAKIGKKMAEELEMLPQQKLVTEALATIYSETGDYKKALENHEQFKILSDSLLNEENIKKITAIEYEYKYKKELDDAADREVKLTKTVETTSKDLEKTQRNLLLGIITFLAVAMVLGSIIFYLKLRNSKAKTQNIITEQKLLRTQMTPHFIFNSLSVLQGMILNNEENKSVSYLSKFSKLLRITLENSRDKTVLLSHELEAVENYLSLQNIENEKIAFQLHVDKAIETNAIKVPPMLIQPFVENAIEHAFKNQKENCVIEIKLTLVDSKLICVILDNGMGIDSSERNSNQNKKSLATKITKERLDYLSKDFKMDASITIEDRNKYNQQGTQVTIQMPYSKTES